MSNENCKCKTCKCDATTVNESAAMPVNSVKLLTLMDAPKVDCTLTESSDNVLYVNSLDVIQGLCGTGRIGLLDREVLMNVCESNDTVHVNLDLEVNNTKLSGVPFIVKLTETGETYMELNNKITKPV